ncbi:MAG: putative glycoside hydrolase [Thermomicrobiales bacterium]
MTEPVESIALSPNSAHPLPWVTWWFSAIFVVTLIAVIATVIYDRTSDDSVFEITVVDQASGNAIQGARIQIGADIWVSDIDGVVTLPTALESGQVSVSTSGYQTWSSEIGTDSPGDLTVRLDVGASNLAANDPRPTVVAGATEPPVSTQPPTGTEPAAESTSGTPTAETVSLVVEGKISNGAGKSIQGARLVAAGNVEITGADGLIALEIAELDEASLTAMVIAPGYLDQTIEIDPGNPVLDVVMEPKPIKAVYLNPNISTTEEDVERIADIIDATELNAVVIDIKEELIFYDSQVPFFVEQDVIRPIYDIQEMLAKFEDRGIYTIARLVVFKDSLIAENRPDIAVLNSETGDLWRDDNGVAWVNPMVHELWEANTDLALEAAQFGFDEIQFDYVRFPTDGDFTTMDFGLENTQDVRERSIEKFLAMAQEKVYPTGAKLSADVFGYTMLVNDDLGIGQNFANLAQYVDYLSPMIYPSHFPNGSIDVDGHPNDFPYETIKISMRLGRDKLGGNAIQMRPWLQDFDYFDLMPYGDAEVRAQIDASEDIGASGWMLWDPNNQYHPGALLPDENAPATPEAATLPTTPGATPPLESTPVARQRRRRS